MIKNNKKLGNKGNNMQFIEEHMTNRYETILNLTVKKMQLFYVKILLYIFSTIRLRIRKESLQSTSGWQCEDRMSAYNPVAI